MYKNVVALYGVPRSGTSWLGQILDSCPDIAFRYQPLFSYRFKNRISTESNRKDIECFLEELYEEDNDDFLNQTDKKQKGIYPIFLEKAKDPPTLAFKEARYLYTIPLLLKNDINIKIIGIVRNPYDVLESWINAPSEFNPEWKILDEWQFASKKNEYRPENYYGYNKWKEYIKLNFEMKERYPDKFITIRYEDLVENAMEISSGLFSFLGLSFTDQTRKFIEESQSKTIDNAYTVYRKKGASRLRNFYLPNYIKQQMAQDIKKFKEAKMLGYG